MRQTPIALVITGLLFASHGAAATPEVTVRLVAGHTAAAPGTEVPLGISLRLPAGWHTYWRNPGDSGLAPRFAWHLPSGGNVAPLRWPAPAVFAADGDVTFGYADEFTLLTGFRIPPAARPGTRLRLAVTVRWLLCRGECVPGTTDAAVEIEVAASPRPRPAELAWLAAAARHLPAADPRLGATARTAGESVELTVHDPHRLGGGPPVYWFPENGEHFTAAPRLAWQAVPGGWRTRLAKAPTWRAARGPLAGLLLFPPAADGSPRAWDLPVNFLTKD